MKSISYRVAFQVITPLTRYAVILEVQSHVYGSCKIITITLNHCAYSSFPEINMITHIWIVVRRKTFSLKISFRLELWPCSHTIQTCVIIITLNDNNGTSVHHKTNSTDLLMEERGSNPGRLCPVVYFGGLKAGTIFVLVNQRASNLSRLLSDWVFGISFGDSVRRSQKEW